jgi:8-oxo-dGTP pyrophosphatase MutT (NUDIX family)
MLEVLKERLKKLLKEELPGEYAHSMMMPTVRDDRLKKPSVDLMPIKSAVLILFYPDEHGHVKFPLIQRPAYNGAHGSQVSLPGGKEESQDESLIHTALREAQEEIGIDPSLVEIIGNLSDLFIWVSNFLVTPVIGITNQKPHFAKDDIEVDAIIEADLFDIIDPSKRRDGTIVARGKYRIQTPYFEIDNRIVWGATAMMLSELSIIIGKAKIF